MKFQNTRNKNHSKARGTEPVPHKGAGIGINLALEAGKVSNA